MPVRALLHCCALTLLAAGALRGQVPDSERQALIALYAGLDGDAWSESQRANWLGATGTECTWAGVRCTADRVTSIRVSSPGGTLPDVFGAFPQLSDLTLTGGFGGDPAVVLDATMLTGLTLSSRSVTADLPSFQGLPSLQFLTLRTASSGPLPDFSGLDQLIALQILTDNVGTFVAADNPALADLFVSAPVTAVDWSGLASLPSLAFLSTYTLAGGDLPDVTSGFPALTYLDIGGYRLASNFAPGPIPQSYCDKPLTFLGLGATNRTGDIPECLGSMPLTGIFIPFNDFTPGPIPDFSALDLEFLDLAYTNRTGPIPAWLWDEQWSYLSLEHNELTGPVSARIGEQESLWWLRLDSNRLIGAIPDTLPAPSGGFGCFNLQFNALSTGSTTVADRVNAAQTTIGCLPTSQVSVDFRNTETTAPRNVTATPGGAGEVVLTWAPIRYQANQGEYVILQAEQRNGPYVTVGRTASKADSTFTVSGLTGGREYFFRIRTLTRPHALNANRVISPPSALVQAVAP